MSVVGASVIVWDPETEFGSVARKVSSPTEKNITTISFSDLMDFSPLGWVLCGTMEVGLFLEAGLISEENYLRGVSA